MSFVPLQDELLLQYNEVARRSMSYERKENSHICG